MIPPGQLARTGKEVGVVPTFFVGGKSGEMKDVRGATKSGPKIAPELIAELESIARHSDCELVQAELKGNVLRVILDKEGGISLGDCEQVAKHVSAYLDVVDFGRSRYVLEVSSPGLDRQLYKPRDYARFVGSLARVTYRMADGKKRTVVGRLQAFDPEPAPGVVTVVEEPAGEELSLRLEDVQLARLEIEL
jgi:ribosome maturation factor RimP